MDDLISLGALPGTFFCIRCDRNRWFSEGGVCGFCGHREYEVAALGGLNPTPGQLAAMRRREHADPRAVLARKLERLGDWEALG
ncbi:hypothetical protein [Amycolatopsis jejuensis]|uniref:hypothetical protein n=1 Tax=Amycolatopsis jejuensis TaxID=330084 RepID=UPI00052444E2|nr:hypothetical protein [Amycolatopsis jejuensis]